MLTEEIGKACTWCYVPKEAYKTNVLIRGMFMASSMKAAIYLGPDILKNSNIYKNTRFENIENVFNTTQKIDKRTSRKNSECEKLGRFITIMDEISTGQRPGGQIGEGKSLFLRFLRSMCWSDGKRSRSSRMKMERPICESQDVFIISRCSGTRWRSKRIRAKKCPMIFNIDFSSRDPERLGEEHCFLLATLSWRFLGWLLEYSNTYEPEEERFSVRNQTFTESDAGKTALFRTFLTHAPNFSRKDTSAHGTLRHQSRIDRAFIKLAHGGSTRFFTATPMWLTILVSDPYHMTTWQCVLSYGTIELFRHCQAHFRDCLFFTRFSETSRRRTPNQRTSRTRSSSCQCSMTLCGKQMMRIAFLTLEKVKDYAKKILPGHWTFLGPGSEKRWYGLSSKVPALWVVESWIRKEGKRTIHFNGDSRNSKLLFQTVCSFNQLIVNGAVTGWCYQFGLANEEKEQVNIPLKNWIASMMEPEEVEMLVSPSETDTWKQDAGKRELLKP